MKKSNNNVKRNRDLTPSLFTDENNISAPTCPKNQSLDNRYENSILLKKFKHEAKKQIFYKDKPEIVINTNTTQESLGANLVRNNSSKAVPNSANLNRKHTKVEFANTEKEIVCKPNDYMQSNSIVQWEPNNWFEVVQNLRKMREKKDAPVDTMGCDKCIDDTADKKIQRFHSLVALMLSSQTKDQLTHATVQKLNELNGKLTVSTILKISEPDLANLLYPVSFYKNKARYIKSTVEILRNQYNDDIPNTVLDLCKLPGVGPKMAHLCMQIAWGETTGIGVDIHVHRISNRLGWVKQLTKNPESTRNELESWLPKELWGEINEILVGFGQMTCKPIKPKCGECLNKKLCPVGRGEKPADLIRSSKK